MSFTTVICEIILFNQSDSVVKCELLDMLIIFFVFIVLLLLIMPD